MVSFHLLRVVGKKIQKRYEIVMHGDVTRGGHEEEAAKEELGVPEDHLESSAMGGRRAAAVRQGRLYPSLLPLQQPTTRPKEEPSHQYGASQW